MKLPQGCLNDTPVFYFAYFAYCNGIVTNKHTQYNAGAWTFLHVIGLCNRIGI